MQNTNLTQYTWSISYYSPPGDYNTKVSTVVSGIIENNKYIAKLNEHNHIWTPVIGVNNQYTGFLMTKTRLIRTILKFVL